jgi:hypothetical protein
MRRPDTDAVITSRSVSSAPAGYRFPREVIAVAVRWYLRYGLSYRDVEELLAERGIAVDHMTSYRWVQTFTAEFIDAARPARHASGDRWFVDKTYSKVAGRWSKPITAEPRRGCGRCADANAWPRRGPSLPGTPSRRTCAAATTQSPATCPCRIGSAPHSRSSPCSPDSRNCQSDPLPASSTFTQCNTASQTNARGTARSTAAAASARRSDPVPAATAASSQQVPANSRRPSPAPAAWRSAHDRPAPRPAETTDRTVPLGAPRHARSTARTGLASPSALSTFGTASTSSVLTAGW